MIYEMRTYTLKPGATGEFEKRFAEALPHREKHSKLAAFWHTDIGPLNQVIHLWAYQDLNERSRVQAEVRQDPNWPPPNLRELIVSQESRILVPAAFSPLR